MSLTNARQIRPSFEDFENAKHDLLNLIESDREGKDLPFIAGAVRLAFHDCVGEGFCDGCIDHSNPGNAGLKEYSDKIDELYKNYTGKISRADMYALAAVVALNRSTYDAPVKYQGLKHFKVGRKDCSKSPDEDKSVDLPKGTDGTKKTFKFFAKEFGFNEREATTLLGAHTLGKCTLENSGFDGAWVGKEFSTVKPGANTLAPTSVLDNAYYREIIDRVDWIQVPLKNGKKQWQVPDHPIPNDVVQLIPKTTLLLNSDISLSWNIEPKDGNGTVSCKVIKIKTPKTCSHSSSHKYAKEFAHNNRKWVEEFTSVFNRMIEKNTYTLHNAPTRRYPYRPPPYENRDLLIDDVVGDVVDSFVDDVVNKMTEDFKDGYNVDSDNK